MNKFLFWQKWLFGVGLLISVFGVFMAFFSGTVLFQMFDTNINQIFWGSGEVVSNVRMFEKWIYGAWGATVSGWGVFIIFIAYYPFQKKEKWAWWCLLFGLLLWFLIDTGFSAYFKVYINVGLNSILFVLSISPLVFTKKYFK